MKVNDLSIVVSAPSGTGKTTLISRLLRMVPELAFVTSTTTREKRINEEEGKSYYYVSDKRFKEMCENNEFLEWAKVHGNCYGTTKKEVDRIQEAGKIPVFDVDVQGARSLKPVLDGAISIFIVPPSMEVLKSRLKERGTDSAEQVETRFNNAITELKEYTMYDYLVVNEKIDPALSDLYSIIRSQMLTRAVMEEKVKLIMEGR